MTANNPHELRATTILRCCPYFLDNWTIGHQNQILREIQKGEYINQIENWWFNLTPNQQADIIEWNKKAIQLEIAELQKEIESDEEVIKQLRGKSACGH